MHRQVSKDYMQQLASSFNLSIKEVEDIVKSQYELVKETITKSNAMQGEPPKNIYFRNLGKFAVIKHAKIRIANRLAEEQVIRDYGITHSSEQPTTDIAILIDD